jgi:hypothetical protein
MASTLASLRGSPREMSATGITAVYRSSVANYVAACSCGWSARSRLLRATACQDAWLHAAGTGCGLASPLVVKQVS